MELKPLAMKAERAQQRGAKPQAAILEDKLQDIYSVSP